MSPLSKRACISLAFHLAPASLTVSWAEATTPSEDTWAPTYPAVPVMIHSFEMLLDDSKLHGDEEVTGCTMGCLHLLYKMFQSNFCSGAEESSHHWSQVPKTSD